MVLHLGMAGHLEHQGRVAWRLLVGHRMVAAAGLGWGRELQLLVRLPAVGRGWGRARLRVVRPALGRAQQLGAAHQPVVDKAPHHPVLAGRGCRMDPPVLPLAWGEQREGRLLLVGFHKDCLHRPELPAAY